MEEFFEKTITSKQVFKGKILDLYFDEVQLPNGKTATREKVIHQGAVAIVPLTRSGEVLMVRQFRYPLGNVLLEIPAGKLDRGEKPVACAKRELLEEVGADGGSLVSIASIYSAPGYSNEKLEIFLARDFKEEANNPDHDEFLRIEKISLSMCIKMVHDGTINDAKSIVGILMARDFLSKEEVK
jgi:ADP-ribose pyrophosphatase